MGKIDGRRRRQNERVEKYISPGEKVELLPLIGEFVFTIGLGFSGGFKRPFASRVVPDQIHTHTHILYIGIYIYIYNIHVLPKANTRDSNPRIFHEVINNEKKKRYGTIFGRTNPAIIITIAFRYKCRE